MVEDPAQNKVGKAGRRGGKTVWLIAELGDTCIIDNGFCGWGGPNFPILRDAWRDIIQEFSPWIVRASNSESPWVIEFVGGGRAEFWSLDQHVVARSRKYHKFIVDEAGVIRNLEERYNAEIEPTLVDFNGKLVAGSTPNAVSPGFTKWFQLGQLPGSGWKSWKWTSLDNPAVAANAAKRIEAARARGVPEWIIQQEYFAEETEDETGFFPKAMIERCKRDWGREPLAVGRIDCLIEDVFERESVVANRQVSRIRWIDDPSGPWKFWQWWDGDRPPQDAFGLALGAGVDLGWGVGASNTVFAFVNSDTREKIAEFASPNVTPEEAANLFGMGALWLGGREGARLTRVCPEANGPGEKFIKQLRALRYGNIYGERAVPSAIDANDPGRIGWRSGPTAKRIMLDEYRAALATGRYINPSIAGLEECLTYHQDGKGNVMSETEWLGEDTEDNARAPHGDRVIADGLANIAMQQVGKAKPPELVPARGTVAEIIQRKRAEREAKDRW